jgi:alpha-tubulin suppressor-like RCC1 family protein
MSFAVKRTGETYAWGENKNNQLLLPDEQKHVLNVEIPTKITYPKYFEDKAS